MGKFCEIQPLCPKIWRKMFVQTSIPTETWAQTFLLWNILNSGFIQINEFNIHDIYNCLSTPRDGSHRVSEAPGCNCFPHFCNTQFEMESIWVFSYFDSWQKCANFCFNQTFCMRCRHKCLILPSKGGSKRAYKFQMVRKSQTQRPSRPPKKIELMQLWFPAVMVMSSQRPSCL